MAKLRGVWGAGGSKGKEPPFWGSDQRVLTSDNDVNFTLVSGPPVHAIPPGVFDRTGGDLHPNGAQYGRCLGILGERRTIRARIGVVVKSEKRVVFERDFRRGEGD